MGKNFSVRFKTARPGEWIATRLTEKGARASALGASQRLKKRAVEVVDGLGNAVALFLNGKDVS